MNTLNSLASSKIFQSAVGAVVLLLIARSAMILVPDCTVLPNFLSPWFALAIVLAVIYRIINAYGWTLVLRAMNHDVNGLQATRIWLRGESRRWLPGGVWGYASRAIQAEQIGVPKKVASASMLVELLITVAAAVIVFIPILLIFHEELTTALGALAKYEWLFWIAIVITATVVIACFIMRTKLADKLQLFKQRFALVRGLEVNQRKLLTVLGFYILMGCLNGCVTCCLIWSMPIDQHPPILIVIAATSFSWVVGFLAVFAPGGMVVREATFAACLGIWMPYSTALAIAILARIVQLAAEVAGMVWAWACGIEWFAGTQRQPKADPLVRL